MEAIVLYYKCCELITMKNEGIGVLNIYSCCFVVKGYPNICICNIKIYNILGESHFVSQSFVKIQVS
jgi:hypothetical protein